MKISELRRLLYAVKKQHGDIEVFVRADNNGMFASGGRVRVPGEDKRKGYPCYIVPDSEPDFKGWSTQITYMPSKRGAKRRIDGL